MDEKIIELATNAFNNASKPNATPADLKLAAEYAKILNAESDRNLELKKLEVEEANLKYKLAVEQTTEKLKIEAEEKQKKKDRRMTAVKLGVLTGVTVGGFIAENHYMFTSWFTKNFIQRADRL